MEKLKSGLSFVFSSYKRTAIVFIIGALALSIPITLNLLQQQQDIRQRASQVCANVAADIMLVIDKSGSMNDRTSGFGSPTLLTKAKEAASQFVDTISTNTQNKVGLVSFSSENRTSLNEPLTSNFSSVKTKINSIDADGETCTQCGIKKANEQISQNKRAGFKNVVILLTDGRANARIGSSNNSETLAEQAALTEAKAGNTTNDTVYFTIGLGSKVNADFLQGIANETGGKYFFAPSANDLQSIYTQISQIVGKGSVSGFVYNDVNGNGVQEDTEQKLTGWQLTLKSQDQATNLTATTDTTGGFNITGICDAEYTLTLTPQNGWSTTSPVGGSYDIIIVNGDSQADKSFGVQEATPTSIPTATPTATLTATPTSTPSSTVLRLQLGLVGIGNATNSALGINNSPERPERSVEVEIFNSQNQRISSVGGTVNFTLASGAYEGNIELGEGFTSGPYIVKARMDNTLWKQVPGIQNITAGQTYTAPFTELVSGDVIHDNVINLLDYNAMISCLRDRNDCSVEDGLSFNSIKSFIAMLIGAIKN